MYHYDDVDHIGCLSEVCRVISKYLVLNVQIFFAYTLLMFSGIDVRPLVRCKWLSERQIGTMVISAPSGRSVFAKTKDKHLPVFFPLLSLAQVRRILMIAGVCRCLSSMNFKMNMIRRLLYCVAQFKRNKKITLLSCTTYWALPACGHSVQALWIIIEVDKNYRKYL